MKKITINDLKEHYTYIYEFIKAHDMIKLDEKRYELGNKAYVNIESYHTYKFEERRYESHIDYIDLQYIITGKEIIVVKPIFELVVDSPYNPDRDIIFYHNNIRGINMIMDAGDMMLLEPEDGHMPCVSVEDSVYVKKAVFKIPVVK